jgi:hypothetical protein
LNVNDGTIRKLAKRPSSNLGDLWVRLPLVPLHSRIEGWCSSRRPVNPLPLNCESVGERFNSFTTHFPSGPVVYWLGHHPLKVKKGVRLPSGLFAIEVVSKHPRRGRCPIGSHKADLPGSIPGPGTLRAGWCSAEFHKLGGRGSTPGPANRCEVTVMEVTGWHGTRISIAIRSRA